MFQQLEEMTERKKRLKNAMKKNTPEKLNHFKNWTKGCFIKDT